MPSNSPILRLAQISDLHFVEKLTEEGRTHWLKQFGTKSHAFAKIEALAGAFSRAEHPSKGGPIDILIATGDISTDGSTAALQTALSFIENTVVNDSHGVPATFGLRKGPQQRLVLPGNHDRYNDEWFPQQTYTTALEAVFSTFSGSPEPYPYTVGYRPSVYSSDSDAALLFFVFDSNLGPKSRMWTPNRIARGRFKQTHHQQLLDEIAGIKRTGQVKDINGGILNVDYEKTFRIALVHHHPVKKATRFRDRFWDSTKMENAELFVHCCYDAGVDLILFGHRHEEYYDTLNPISDHSWQPPLNAHPIYYFCCYSSSEYAEKSNGFYVIDFYEDKFQVSPYHWNGALFEEKGAILRPYKRAVF